MIRKIVDATNPILRKKAKPVKKIDKKIKNLAKDLIETLKNQKDPEGVGLAAPQVGKSLKMFAMVDNEKIRIIINPKIISAKKDNVKDKDKEPVMEGCLSVPHYYGPVSRPQKLMLEFTTLEGKKTKEEFKGFSAQIIQHEVDHLEGKLFIDKLIKQKKGLYLFKKDKWEEVDLPHLNY